MTQQELAIPHTWPPEVQDAFRMYFRAGRVRPLAYSHNGADGVQYNYTPRRGFSRFVPDGLKGNDRESVSD